MVIITRIPVLTALVKADNTSNLLYLIDKINWASEFVCQVVAIYDLVAFGEFWEFFFENE